MAPFLHFADIPLQFGVKYFIVLPFSSLIWRCFRFNIAGIASVYRKLILVWFINHICNKIGDWICIEAYRIYANFEILVKLLHFHKGQQPILP